MHRLPLNIIEKPNIVEESVIVEKHSQVFGHAPGVQI